MCRLSWNLGASNSWKTHGLSRPFMGLLYVYFYLLRVITPTKCTIFIHYIYLLDGVNKEVFDHTRIHGTEYFLIDQFLPRLIVSSKVLQSSSLVFSIIQHYFRHPVVRDSEMHSVNSPAQNPSPSATNNKSQRYNRSIIRRGNIAERACLEVKMWKIPPMDCLAVGWKIALGN